MLKNFVQLFQYIKEIFDLQERYNNGSDLANKNSFFNNYTINSFSVCYCYNFIIAYNNSYAYNV